MVASLSAFTRLSQLGASPRAKSSTNTLTLRGTGQKYFAPSGGPGAPTLQQMVARPLLKRRSSASSTSSSPFASLSSARRGRTITTPRAPSASPFASLSSSFRGGTTVTPRADAKPTPEMTSEIQLGLQRLIKGFRSASGKARTANEKRYQKLLRENKLFGSRRRAEISGEFAQREQELGAQQQQRLQAQGMAGTTVGATLSAGLGRNIERERQSAFTQLGEQMRSTRAGIIERRQDIGPDPAAISSLIAGIGGQFGAKGLPTLLKAFQGLQV